MGWRDERLFPHHTGAGWAICEGSRVLDLEAYEVRNRLQRWQPQSAILVAPPGAARFTTPVMIPEVADIATRSARRRTRLLMLICAGVTLAGLALYAWTPSNVLLGWVFGFAGTAAMFAADLAGPLSSVAGIDERARFVYWFRTRPANRIGVIFWSALITGAGVAQYRLVQRLGGHAAVFHAYGVMYGDVRAGEWWRLLTGPFLHYTPMHFLQNFLFLILVGAVAWAVLGAASSIATFVAGNILGAIAQMQFGAQLYDSVGGVSGGVYALLGLIVVYGALRRGSLPQGLATLVLILAVTGVGMSELASVTTATTAHVAGFISGCAIGALLAWRSAPAGDGGA